MPTNGTYLENGICPECGHNVIEVEKDCPANEQIADTYFCTHCEFFSVLPEDFLPGEDNAD